MLVQAEHVDAGGQVALLAAGGDGVHRRDLPAQSGDAGVDVDPLLREDQAGVPDLGELVAGGQVGFAVDEVGPGESLRPAPGHRGVGAAGRLELLPGPAVLLPQGEELVELSGAEGPIARQGRREAPLELLLRRGGPLRVLELGPELHPLGDQLLPGGGLGRAPGVELENVLVAGRDDGGGDPAPAGQVEPVQREVGDQPHQDHGQDEEPEHLVKGDDHSIEGVDQLLVVHRVLSRRQAGRASARSPPTSSRVASSMPVTVPALPRVSQLPESRVRSASGVKSR